MTTVEIQDDFWNSKKLPDLAWFLISGDSSGFPSLSPIGQRKALHLAYSAGFMEVLDYLFRLTCGDTSSARNPLERFDRKSLNQFLRKNSKAWCLIHETPKRWLEFQKEPRKATITQRFNRWAKRELETRLAKAKSENPNVTENELGMISREFWQKDATVKRKQLSKEDMRKSIIKASTTIRAKVSESAYAAKKLLKNKKVFSADLNEERIKKYYLEKMEPVFRKYGSKESGNDALFKRLSLSVQKEISKEGEHNLKYLMRSDGTPPSIEEIENHLHDATWLLFED